MSRIIINADDLGLNQRVNDAVFALMHAGRLTSATIMSGGAALDDACTRCKDLPRCSFGVHLNLTELAPETKDAALAPLLDERGQFANRARQTVVTPQLATAIEREWIAQIEKVRARGVPISHLDGHHHIHTHAPFFRILKRVQKATNIRRARTTMNLYSPADPIRGGLPQRLKKLAWHLALKHASPSTRTTSIFTAFAVYQDLLPRVPNAPTVELMVHPGTDDPIFSREERQMVTPWEKRANFPITLISYNDL
jgi:predicted glycoside hydrolase/deacetylase ChbG (UPF0249 family)